VEGEADAFCCGGCEAAAAIIRGAGLDRYYAERAACPPRPEPLAGAWTSVPVEARRDGTVAARLVVDGLRCASCVWVTERVLERTPGVVEATVSYATGRATLRWDPAVTGLGTLAGRIAALGYRPRPLGEEAAPDRDLMLRLGVAGFAAMNIMLLAATIYTGWWDGMDPAWAGLFRWTALVLATPVALWCAAPFFSGAWAGLRHRVLHLDLPIALAVTVLYAHGIAATLAGRDGYLDSLAMLVTLLLAGRLLESRGRRRAAEAAMSLAAAVPGTARRAAGGRLETVPVEALRPGDRIDAGAGEELAADGVVVEGSGQVRMALLTGESEPVVVARGDRVVAGAVLQDGAITVEVRAVGRETVLQQMAAGLQHSADSGLRPTAADRIAPWFTAATLVVAAVTCAVWLGLRGVDTAVARTVAVLVVACPCALALSQPLAAAAGLGAAARRGLLFRSAHALLDLDDVTLVALDKTGTVTAGVPVVTTADDATLRVAAGLERYSTHPIARAIVAEAIRRGIPLPRGTDVREEAGVGVTGVVDGRPWRLRRGGPGEVLLLDDAGSRESIRLADAVRPDAAQTIAALRGLGRRVVLLTGDHPDVARRIARTAGVDEVVAGAEPAAKVSAIQGFRSAGHRVLFAGDGLNDGPALAAADVGVAMGHGAASSVLVADGVIAGDALGPLVAGFQAARACRAAIRANQRRSLAYNALAVTAAALGWVNPLVAAVLMPLSSGMVIWGASRVEARVRRREG
jgi:Cu2+-exporting ATPase